jgi:DNA-binding CsgD family transcriptional regulator
VSKRDATAQVLEAIRRVHRGKLSFSPNVESEMLARIVRGDDPAVDSAICSLSDRELEIGRLIGGGATTREIAARLCVSIKTVETHRAHLKEKLGLENSVRLMKFWVSWLASDEARKEGIPGGAPAANGEPPSGEADSRANGCSDTDGGRQPSDASRPNGHAPTSIIEPDAPRSYWSEGKQASRQNGQAASRREKVRSL